MTEDDVVQNLVSVVRSERPGAELTTTHESVFYKIRYSEKTHDDPRRKNKRSKTLFIVFDEADIQDWADATERTFAQMLSKLRLHLHERFQTFDPSNDCPQGIEPPHEVWPINAALLR